MFRRPPRGLMVVITLFGVLFLGVADNQVISPLLPAVRAQFGRASYEMGYLFTGYSLAAGISVLLWGPLSDAFGARRGLLAGLVVFGLGSALSFSAGTYAVLLAGRVVTGMGASLLSLNTISYAADAFPYEVRGWAMSSIFSSYFAALILGVPIGSLAADYLGWNAVFALSGLTALGLLVGAVRMLPECPDRPGKRPTQWIIARQLERYLGFLKSGRTAGALLSSLFASAGTTGFIAFVGVWLHDSFGISGKQIGLVFLASGTAALIVSPFAGSLSDRIGKRIQFIVSNSFLALVLLFVPALRWGVLLFLAFGLVSLAAAFRQGPMEALITELVPGGLRGSFIALKNSCSQMGIAAAALISGILFENAGYLGVCLLCSGLNVLAALSMTLSVREKQL